MTDDPPLCWGKDLYDNVTGLYIWKSHPPHLKRQTGIWNETRSHPNVVWKCDMCSGDYIFPAGWHQETLPLRVRNKEPKT